MNIRAISTFNYNKKMSFKNDEKKLVKEAGIPNKPERPQIWFSTEIGPNGREMGGTHLLGYSDVIGPDGTRAPIYDTGR
jgi:hypothetical protein